MNETWGWMIDWVVLVALVGYVLVALEVGSGAVRGRVRGLEVWEWVTVVVASVLWPCGLCWVMVRRARGEKGGDGRF